MKEFKINQDKIAPGQQKVIEIPVGNLPSGNPISIKAFIYRSKQPGPTVLALSGVHGDEINGVEIVKRAISGGIFNKLKCGSVIAIPLLNIYGFINFSRDSPDGKDVNRNFPGSANGSLASRIAFVLTEDILPYIDFGIDYHTGGMNLYNYPQIRFSKGDVQAEELAKVYATPYVVKKTPISKSLRKTAMMMDKPILLFEGGESMRYDGFSISKGLNGLKKILNAHGMTDFKFEDHSPASITIEKTSWLRASRAGMFLWYKCSGNRVNKGEPLGEINDPYGKEIHRIRSPRDGFIIGHNNAPVVNQGDALFHLGYQEEGEDFDGDIV